MNPIELSFEFFPPKTQEGVDKLRAMRAMGAELIFADGASAATGRFGLRRPAAALR